MKLDSSEWTASRKVQSHHLGEALFVEPHAFTSEYPSAFIIQGSTSLVSPFSTEADTVDKRSGVLQA